MHHGRTLDYANLLSSMNYPSEIQKLVRKLIEKNNPKTEIFSKIIKPPKKTPNQKNSKNNALWNSCRIPQDQEIHKQSIRNKNKNSKQLNVKNHMKTTVFPKMTKRCRKPINHKNSKDQSIVEDLWILERLMKSINHPS